MELYLNIKKVHYIFHSSRGHIRLAKLKKKIFIQRVLYLLEANPLGPVV